MRAEPLKLRTPCCNRTVHQVQHMESATLVIKRTCPSCRVGYVVVVRPLGARGGAFFTEVEWTPCVTKVEELYIQT